jgi:hypothetical protein
MPRNTRIERALLSVTDKTGIVEFARALTGMGVEILSTGGTFRALKEGGIAPLREVADVTQFPEMLDGRVKTIHPRIAAGILAVRSKSEHMRAIAEHGIPRIDLVAVSEEGRFARRIDREYRYRRPDHDPGGGQELAGCRRDHLYRRLRRDHRRTQGRKMLAFRRNSLEAGEESVRDHSRLRPCR